MTAKEKARELVAKFNTMEAQFIFIDEANDEVCHSGQITHFTSKQCALICVEEILEVVLYHEQISYWREVKSEIEKL